MKFLVFVGSFLLVFVAIKFLWRAFERRINDPRLFKFEMDPYFNRDYARPSRERCSTCGGTGRASRFRRCPTCLGRSAKVAPAAPKEHK